MKSFRRKLLSDTSHKTLISSLSDYFPKNYQSPLSMFKGYNSTKNFYSPSNQISIDTYTLLKTNYIMDKAHYTMRTPKSIKSTSTKDKSERKFLSPKHFFTYHVDLKGPKLIIKSCSSSSLPNSPNSINSNNPLINKINSRFEINNSNIKIKDKDKTIPLTVRKALKSPKSKKLIQKYESVLKNNINKIQKENIKSQVLGRKDIIRQILHINKKEFKENENFANIKYHMKNNSSPNLMVFNNENKNKYYYNRVANINFEERKYNKLENIMDYSALQNRKKLFKFHEEYFNKIGPKRMKFGQTSSHIFNRDKIKNMAGLNLNIDSERLKRELNSFSYLTIEDKLNQNVLIARNLNKKTMETNKLLNESKYKIRQLFKSSMAFMDKEKKNNQGTNNSFVNKCE